MERENGVRWSLYFRKGEEEYLDSLRKLATKTDRSVNSLIMRAIRDFISSFESGQRDISELM